MRRATIALLLAAALLPATLMPGTLAAQQVGTSPLQTLLSGGYPRSFAIFNAGSTPKPLLIVLHGESQDGAAIQAITGFDALARTHGLMIAYPDASHKIWSDGRKSEESQGRTPSNLVNDVQFITDLAASLVKDNSADPKRIYLVGISSGGAMALRVACDAPQLFAGVVSFLATMPPSMMASCNPATPIPVLLLNGSKDPLLSYEGNRPTDPRKIATPAIIEVLALWTGRNGCSDAPPRITALPDPATDDGARLYRHDYACPAGADVAHIKVEGGGHRLPARVATPIPPIVERLVGKQSHDADAAELAWDFLRHFGR